MNPMERCVRMVTSLIERAVAQYQKTPNKGRIHLMTFEDFAERPAQEIDRICIFLGVRPTPHTTRFIEEARCPRVLDPADRQRKLSEFKTQVRQEYLEKLKDLAAAFEDNLYSLRDSSAALPEAIARHD